MTLIFLSLNLLFCYLWDYLFILRVVLCMEGKKNTNGFIGSIWNKWLILFISENTIELLSPSLKALLIYLNDKKLLSIIYVPRTQWLYLFIFYFLFALHPDLLTCTWHTALYKFKVHNIIIWLISWNNFHNKCSEHTSLHIDIELKK